MKYVYYDTETTGIKIGKDRIIEIAAYDPVGERSFSTFTNPECPIPAESTAITHITDEMVKEAPLIRAALEAFIAFCGEDVMLIAHNNDAFDQPFLVSEFARADTTMPEWKFIDSLKWSRKYRSDLPKHSLQFLREVYGVEANQAHRALDDVMVLYKVFSSMIDDLDMDTVMSLLTPTPQGDRMPFGKHAGKMLAEVPKSYIQWLLREGALDKKENAELKNRLTNLGMLA
ncbi:MAG: DNA polymerase III subunit epsilon [Chlamydiae bacterium RIFCSPHIGHO2_12_FULL_44_59]|nr:MAG: DNA polymerase III subunit epsilon [Chlamydiae bacterium RIFCSPHIGHO2_01_FULL_44_39]OGN57933.1 MAG: DNA polymerase III subunit epsilon [Chlamydiae bacterium RIFCSPHIGHO2_02_FULL_45_9]OGN60765.1 MAG: DNA polymerase III subunit epsilon [Chlamydiae bacterium RIFCSPHIGHO2_12_FULL_44_59]OGN67025.1 MAG: DNA polymerase III subunit epsilon [Chlamydiae bacterium RIFCSPLOWO2_01_FULL_44_52]OGN67578.1 MAG: DNA polymerase III subunit epsilon [Chlamydiae bacterium RIFCSPLOWO2_02_FULL_45_22]OGN71279.